MVHSSHANPLHQMENGSEKKKPSTILLLKSTILFFKWMVILMTKRFSIKSNNFLKIFPSSYIHNSISLLPPHTPSCEIVITPELLWILRKKETSVAGETILTCLHEKRWPWYLLITVYPVTSRSSYQAQGVKKSLGLASPLAPSISINYRW